MPKVFGLKHGYEAVRGCAGSVSSKRGSAITASYPSGHATLAMLTKVAGLMFRPFPPT